VAVVGARPNFVKLAPLLRAARGRLRWIHTGQHESPALAQRLWRELGLPAPAASLAHVTPGPRRAERMAEPLLEPLARLAPRLVVVVGDVDSTVAGALAATRLGIPLAHVEAGLRTHERGLPEERNRKRVDRLSDLLHTSEPSATAELRREGVPPWRIHEAGNVMADALAWALPRAPLQPAPVARAYSRDGYGVVTLHRAGNVDDRKRLYRFVSALVRLAQDMPLVFPVHPRTARLVPAFMRRKLPRVGLHMVEPFGYLEMLATLAHALLVVTDSGGLPVEASLLDLPCVTLRARYEHRLTLTHGTNVLAGGDPRRLRRAVDLALVRLPTREPRPRAWDGRASERCVERWEAEFLV
jgi:UDP-N-acetylglucosamine 2-epimerase (non-hydrolysing)